MALSTKLLGVNVPVPVLVQIPVEAPPITEPFKLTVPIFAQII